MQTWPSNLGCQLERRHLPFTFGLGLGARVERFRGLGVRGLGA